MECRPRPPRFNAAPLKLACLPVLAAMALSACGGGADNSMTAEGVATPHFQLAPVELTAPDQTLNLAAIHTEAVLSGMETLPRAGLLPETIHAQLKALRAARRSAGQSEVLPAAASATAMTVFQPAQIRAAYGLPAVTGSAAPAGAAAQAALGAGQTIYLVDANHHPNALSDLNAYSRQFNMPGCTSVAITPATPLPLTAASTSAGCTFSVVYADANGKRTTTAPAYDSGWAFEIALDVEQAHAMAPLARIVLIEAPSSGTTVLAKAVALANSMGSGIVSMSFGAAEGSWMAAMDSNFQGSNMQYFASTGDSGTGVNWPSVSARVVAVGGTTLTLNGTSRAETVWSGTGGGTSKYVPVPAYQMALSKTIVFRRAADVAMVSDPNTGQYIGFTPSGGTFGWYSAGGTSIAAPAWAGIAAVINAKRLAGGLTMLPSFQNALYNDVLAVPASYRSAFLDVISGNDGNCTTCSSTAGYDAPTGMGTPNGAALIAILSTVAQ